MEIEEYLRFGNPKEIEGREPAIAGLQAEISMIEGPQN